MSGDIARRTTCPGARSSARLLHRVHRLQVLIHRAGRSGTPDVRSATASLRPKRGSGFGAPCNRAVRCGDSRAPTRCPPVRWGFDRGGVESRAFQQPRDDRIRVPHLARSNLVAAPNQVWNARRELEDPARDALVVAEPAWAVDGLTDVGNLTVTPSAQLPAEHPKPGRPPRADRAHGHHAAFRATVVVDGSLFDDVAAVWDVEDEPGVIQVARRPPLDSRSDGFVDLSVETDEIAARSKRQPVQVDSVRPAVHPG